MQQQMRNHQQQQQQQMIQLHKQQFSAAGEARHQQLVMAASTLITFPQPLLWLQSFLMLYLHSPKTLSKVAAVQLNLLSGRILQGQPLPKFLHRLWPQIDLIIPQKPSSEACKDAAKPHTDIFCSQHKVFNPISRVTTCQ
ncbi:hypothetical protein GBA52_005640 [Prunus armeniaca]|nr:hypothetical protein GBA52_005640 [Prunus armeniaca]